MIVILWGDSKKIIIFTKFKIHEQSKMLFVLTIEFALLHRPIQRKQRDESKTNSKWYENFPTFHA